MHSKHLHIFKVRVVAGRDDGCVVIWESEELVHGIWAGLGANPTASQIGTALDLDAQLVPAYAFGLLRGKKGMVVMQQGSSSSCSVHSFFKSKNIHFLLEVLISGILILNRNTVVFSCTDSFSLSVVEP